MGVGRAKAARSGEVARAAGLAAEAGGRKLSPTIGGGARWRSGRSPRPLRELDLASIADVGARQAIRALLNLVEELVGGDSGAAGGARPGQG